MKEFLWHDRKRIMGLPISFTKYSLTEDRLFTDVGFLSSTEEQLQLYMVKDISLKRSLFQKMLGLGTVVLLTGDSSNPRVELENIPNSREVKEKIYELVVENKKDRRVMYHENFGGQDDEADEVIDL